MESTRRRLYLDVLGIQSYVRRDLPQPLLVEAEVASGGSDLHQPPEPLPSSQLHPLSIEPPPLGHDWEGLQQQVRECRLCPELVASRSRTVFGVGNRQADWMIIGEAPGVDEDRQGEPFVGRAGQLLNAMLAAMGMARGEVYIANILKCRPAGNRDPAAEEAAHCEGFLMGQIALIQPKIILSLGRISAQNLLKTDTPVGQLRGRVHRLGEQQIPLVVTYHPAYLLRSPEQKAKAWQDLQLAMTTLQTLQSPVS